MFQKQLGYGISGAVIGFILGFIIGFSFINYHTTKGQRGQFTIFVALTIGVGFAIGGLVIGINLGTDAYKEQALGLDNSQEGMFKGGRYWAAMTSWIDPATGKEVKVITGKNDAGTLVSIIGDKTIMNHNINSGSNANVTKYHREARNHVFKTLKENYRNGKAVEDIFNKEL